MSQWVQAFSVQHLPVGGAKLFKQGREQVAVFRPSDAEIYAVDNRCPHEGYPLIQGSREGCTLTCCWHNYKFDLKSGACIKGDEAKVGDILVDPLWQAEPVDAQTLGTRAKSSAPVIPKKFTLSVFGSRGANREFTVIRSPITFAR